MSKALELYEGIEALDEIRDIVSYVEENTDIWKV